MQLVRRTESELLARGLKSSHSGAHRCNIQSPTESFSSSFVLTAIQLVQEISSNLQFHLFFHTKYGTHSPESSHHQSPGMFTSMFSQHKCLTPKDMAHVAIASIVIALRFGTVLPKRRAVRFAVQRVGLFAE